MPMWVNIAIGSVLVASMVSSMSVLHTIHNNNRRSWKPRMWLTTFGRIKLYATIVAVIFYVSYNIFG